MQNLTKIGLVGINTEKLVPTFLKRTFVVCTVYFVKTNLYAEVPHYLVNWPYVLLLANSNNCKTQFSEVSMFHSLPHASHRKCKVSTHFFLISQNYDDWWLNSVSFFFGSSACSVTFIVCM